MRVFVSMLVLSSSFCFTACSNDDENTPQLPDEVTTGTMFGNYTGKMLISSLSPTEKENNEEAPVGVDISASALAAARLRMDGWMYILRNFPLKTLFCLSSKMKP